MSFASNISLKDDKTAGAAYFGTVDYNSYQSDTVFGQMIVCVALYWFQQKLTEGDQNYNDMVSAYANADFSEAWCVVFPAWIMKLVSDLLGVTDYFPGYKYTDDNGKLVYTYGRASLTWNSASDIYGDETDPTKFVPGMIFERNSSSAAASGHMGIIVRNDIANQTIYTIEGNVQYTSKNIYQVGMWSYSYADVKLWDMGALYTTMNAYDEVIAKGYDLANLPTYNGTNCSIIAKSQDNTIVENKTIINQCPTGWTTNADGSCTPPVQCPAGTFYDSVKQACIGQVEFVQGNCPPGSTWDAVKNKCVGQVDLNYKVQTELTTVQKQQKLQSSGCQSYTTYTLPIGDQVLSWANVSGNRVVAYDISTGDLGSQNAQRNGAALGYINDVGRPTGFGMFKDKAKNVIFAIPHRIEQAKTLYDQKLMGGDWYEIVIEHSDFFSGGWAERMGEFFAGYQKYPIKVNSSTGTPVPSNATIDDKAIFEQAFSVQNGIVELVFPGWSMYFNGFLKRLEQICLNAGKHLSKPLVISISAQNPTKLAADELLNFIIIGAAATAAIAGVKIPPEAIKALQTTIKLVDGKRLDLSDYTSIAQTFGAIANYLAPSIVTGVTNYANGVFNDAKTWLANGYTGFYNSLKKDFISAEKALGLDKLQVSSLYYSLLGNGDAIIDYKKFYGTFSSTLKNVQNFKNSILPAALNQYAKSSNFTGDLIASGLDWTANPRLRQIFIIAGTSGVLPTFPNITDMSSKMTSADPEALKTNLYNYKSGPEMHRGIVQNAFGYIPSKNTFNEILLDSLAAEAMDYANAGKTYMLPAGLNSDQAECYKYELERRTSKEVIACQDGFEYDISLSKCVSVNTKVPVYKNNTYICGEGYTYNPDTGLCEANSSTTQISQCPPGYTWDPIKQTCVLNVVKKTDVPPPPTSGGNPTITPINPPPTSGGNPIVPPPTTGGNPILPPPNNGGNPTPIPNPVLPNCIILQNGQYYYKKAGTAIVNSSPVVPVPPPGNFAVLPNGQTNTPAIIPISNELPVKPVVTQTPTVAKQAVSGLVRLNQSLPVVTNISAPSGQVPARLSPMPGSMTLNDTVVIPDMTPAYYGSDKNWYVIVNNITYQIDPLTCFVIVPQTPKPTPTPLPTPIVTPTPTPVPVPINTPTPTPVPTPIVTPQCISVGPNGYVYNYNGINYPAYKGNDGRWYFKWTDGYAHDITDCNFVPPVNQNPPPVTPTPVVPPPVTNNPPPVTPPVTPGSLAYQNILPKCISIDENGNYIFSYQTNKYTAAVSVDGTVKTWHVQYTDGNWYELQDCVPNFPLPKIPPPKYQIPACIALDTNGNYVFAYQGKNLPASVTDQGTSAEQWRAKWTDGIYYPINNCGFTPPPPPPPPGNTPQNTPTPTPGECGCPKEVEEYKRTVYEYPPANQDEECCDE